MARAQKLLFIVVLALPTAAALADTQLSIEHVSAVADANANAGQTRVALIGQTRKRLSRSLQTRLSWRLESAFGDTGLGTLATYSQWSEPWVIGDDHRLELDEATLTWRNRRNRLSIGKQTVAWGVLDGLPITDRLNPVRYRDWVFTEQRPERISRWGLRWRHTSEAFRMDISLSPDATVSQLARPGDTYVQTAARWRGGLPASTQPFSWRTALPDAVTAGARVSFRVGRQDWSVLALRGPDTDPVLSADARGVVLTYPTRTLVGATWQHGIGAIIARAEVAYIPNQTVNLQDGRLGRATRERYLAGVGIDWRLPNSWFANAQLGVDQVAGDQLARPRRDEIVTLRLQRSISNDAWQWQIEVLGNLGDGDGTVRPSVRWQAHDTVRITFGADVVWGEANGLFGQFDHADRLWLRTRISW